MSADPCVKRKIILALVWIIRNILRNILIFRTTEMGFKTGITGERENRRELNSEDKWGFIAREESIGLSEWKIAKRSHHQG